MQCMCRRSLKMCIYVTTRIKSVLQSKSKICFDYGVERTEIASAAMWEDDQESANNGDEDDDEDVRSWGIQFICLRLTSRYTHFYDSLRFHVTQKKGF